MNKKQKNDYSKHEEKEVYLSRIEQTTQKAQGENYENFQIPISLVS